MKMTFRWYGPSDSIPLSYIRQIPHMSGVVTAIYDIPVGEIWPLEQILALKKTVNDAGLEMEVIESLPVHEHIKLGEPDRDQLIKNYKISMRNLAQSGVRVICYNFMPVFDWVRTTLNRELPDGSNALVYYHEELNGVDPLSSDFNLPGWDVSYRKTEIQGYIRKYSEMGAEGLWKNVEYFLKEVIPVAEECGIKMAIHPDDPPWSLFSLPRIITDERNLDRFLSLYDSPYNALTLCTGSLGSGKFNDVPRLVEKYAAADRIAFMHIRNVKLIGETSFEEAAHPSAYGSIDIAAVVKALVDNNFKGYIRPDHGRMIWGETGKPGYGLFDRALGASYVNGLIEATQKYGGK